MNTAIPKDRILRSTSGQVSNRADSDSSLHVTPGLWSR